MFRKLIAIFFIDASGDTRKDIKYFSSVTATFNDVIQKICTL